MNIFELPQNVPYEEHIEQLLAKPGIIIERIISTGQVSPPGFWYDQPGDEWVMLLQGKATIRWESGRCHEMAAGDYVLIRAQEKHRVDYTSAEPPCIWLAVHITE